MIYEENLNLKSNEKTWKAKDAWICLLLLVAWEFVSYGVRSVLHWNLTSFRELAACAFCSCLQRSFSPFGWLRDTCCVFLFKGFIRNFVNDAGLSRRPTLSGQWPGYGFALWSNQLAFLAHYGALNGWTSRNPLGRAYHKIGGEAWSFFQLYAISVGPFSEEIVLRGFLYRAFRGSYGIIISIILIICVASYYHWEMVSHSVFSFTCLSLVQILLCIIRERTGNTWNCVICHAIYNAIVLFL